MVMVLLTVTAVAYIVMMIVRGLVNGDVDGKLVTKIIMTFSKIRVTITKRILR